MPKRIYVDELKVFYDRIGLMDRDDDFLGLQIEPRFVSGFFDWRDLPRLEKFARQHPDYHIVSLLSDGLKVNHVVPTAQLFCLADGDSDPNLICAITERYWQQWADELGNRSAAKSR